MKESDKIENLSYVVKKLKNIISLIITRNISQSRIIFSELID